MDTFQSAARELMAEARSNENGRAARLLIHDGPLRQTLLALTAGTQLAEHNSPPAASILVLEGRLAVTAQETDELSQGQIAALTHHRHGVTAHEDSVFLLTTVTGIPGSTSHDDAE